MLSINRIIMSGNLTKEPEMKDFKDNKTKASFTLAVNKTYKMANGEYKKDTSYFRVITWNAMAKNCGKYLKKGSPVLVEGSLENLSYEDDKGVKKYITQINCDHISFLSNLSNGKNNNDLPASNSELLL